ncbi:MAG TPA: TraR/DksA family transcriptional regulator [Thermoanaerobaculia bacterium]|jgi:DnaK suppressor protein|nr:TraR/DksA family transcriptional regulator [Thermoanaerobaculia bacterium]HPA52295.1 TraR/DksA family transcriptional regulator [Thermoanaerobaculia bacterium]HQP87619.1 TraR/DksA family transcriptional regulator [Thermoanaerobaculia bacterium]
MATKSASAAKKAPAKSAAKTPVKAPAKVPARPPAKAAPKAAEKAAEKAAKDPLEKHRKRLLAKQEELLHDLSRNRQVTDESVDEQAQDMVDRATSAYTREFAFSLSESDRRTLLLIDQALLRLDQGTYGTCVHCQGHVQEKRLEAVPWARHCLECQELQDKGLL